MNAKGRVWCTPGRRSTLFGLAIALWMSSGLPTVRAQELYVTNGQNILVYGRAATLNTYLFRILGNVTLNQAFRSFAVDTVNNELLALVETGPLQASSGVRVYHRGADGNAAPIRVLGTGSGAAPDVTLTLGATNDLPLAGDWDGL